MVTRALVGVAADCVVSDGPYAMVAGNHFDCAVRSAIEAPTGTISRKAKFSLTHHPILNNLVQASFPGYQ